MLIEEYLNCSLWGLRLLFVILVKSIRKCDMITKKKENQEYLYKHQFMKQPKIIPQMDKIKDVKLLFIFLLIFFVGGCKVIPNQKSSIKESKKILRGINDKDFVTKYTDQLVNELDNMDQFSKRDIERELKILQQYVNDKCNNKTISYKNVNSYLVEEEGKRFLFNHFQICDEGRILFKYEISGKRNLWRSNWRDFDLNFLDTLSKASQLLD